MSLLRVSACLLVPASKRPVAKIFSGENYALSVGTPWFGVGFRSPPDSFTSLRKASEQAANRHCNALFGEDYFSEWTFATGPDGSRLEACPFSHNSIDARFWYVGFALAHSLVHGRGRKGLRLNDDAGERTSLWPLGWDT